MYYQFAFYTLYNKKKIINLLLFYISCLILYTNRFPRFIKNVCSFIHFLVTSRYHEMKINFQVVIITLCFY